MTPAIEIRNLTYRYPDGTEALKEVSLAVAEGERVALLGANGAGKSTLLLHFNGIIPSPSVTLFGMRCEKENFKEIRSRIGILFQNPDDQLFSPTVQEDVAFGPRNLGLGGKELTARVRESLHAVGLSDAVGVKAPFHLSMGQKKRAALATVLAMRPEVIALDEPTSSLDPRGKREIVALLAGLEGGLVTVTHDLQAAQKLAERAVVLKEGMVIADAPMGRVLADTALLEEAGLA